MAAKSRRRSPRMSADAKRVAAAEAALEAEMPTRRLSLAEAQRFVDHVAHPEDLDPPLVVYRSDLRLYPTSPNLGSRFSKLAVIASTWLGEPISLKMISRSSAKCSFARSLER
jgi:hypothetical protein